MITKNSYYNWNVNSGDYHRQNADYDKLYIKGKKQDNLKRKFYWATATLVTLLVFSQILAYIAWH